MKLRDEQTLSAGKKTPSDFYHRVYNLVATIPHGKVSTYGHIGAALGAKSSARMVGWALNAAAGRDDVPCHRVVNRMGALSGAPHFSSPTLMRELLEAEEVKFIDDAVDMNAHLWVPPVGEF